MSTRARFQVYPETTDMVPRRWRWRFIAPNGKIMADGGEAYASPSNAKRAIVRFISIADPDPMFGLPAIETVRG